MLNKMLKYHFSYKNIIIINHVKIKKIQNTIHCNSVFFSLVFFSL
jgi:hypothetical protein